MGSADDGGRPEPGHERQQLLGLHGLGEQVALDRPAPQRLQLRELFLCLDTLGHTVQRQRAGQVDDGLGDRRVALVVQLVDERPVDLEDVDWQAPEVAQRAVAGPEVV